MADKKISEFGTFPGQQDSETYYVVASGDSSSPDAANYKVPFTDLALSITGDLELGGGELEGGSYNFGSDSAANNQVPINFNQGENVRMYIDENGGVNVSEKLIVSDGKETILGGNTTVKETLTVADGKETTLGGVTTIKGATTINETLTVADGKQTTLGGPVTIKGDSTFEQSAIFTNLTNDPAPPDGKLYRKGNDLYFGGQKILTEGEGGKWVEGSTNGQSHIHYNEGNVGIGITSPIGAKLLISNGDGNGDTNMAFEDSGAIRYTMGIKDGSQAFQIAEGSVLSPSNPTDTSATRFIIDTNGKVGIRTTSPEHALHVRSTQEESRVVIDNSNGGNTYGGWIGSDGTTDAKLHLGTKMNSTYSDVMTLLSNGNVGIGTKNPAEKFHIKGDNSRMFIGSDDFNIVSIGRRSSTELDSGHLALYKDGNKTVELDTAGHTFFTGGNVGIGTETPTANLAIKNAGQSGETSVHIWNSGDGDIGGAGMVGAYTAWGVKSFSAGVPDYSYHMGIDTTTDDNVPPLLKIGYGYQKWSKPGDTTDIVTISSGGHVVVNGSGNETNAEDKTSGASLTIYNRSSSTNGNFTALNFYGGDRISSSIRSQVVDHNTNEGNLMLYTVEDNSGIGNHKERMRINPNGTSTIQETLDIGSHTSPTHGQTLTGDVIPHRPTLRVQTKSGTSISMSKLNHLPYMHYKGQGEKNWFTHLFDPANNPSFAISTNENSWAMATESRKFLISYSGAVTIPGLAPGGSVQANGSGTLSTSSDKRLKNDLGDSTYGLNEILQIIPKKFTWKDDESETPNIGFFAQDIAEVIPEAAPSKAITNEDGEEDIQWGFSDRPIIAALVNAIKELKSENDSLRSRIEALES